MFEAGTALLGSLQQEPGHAKIAQGCEDYPPVNMINNSGPLRTSVLLIWRLCAVKFQRQIPGAY